MTLYKNILIAILFLVALMLLNSKKLPNSLPIVITTVDTLYKDTIVIKWKSGKSILKDTVIHDTIPQLVASDTMAILKDFFAKNVYKDTFNIPEGVISVIDTISKNQIYGRSYNAKITQKTIKEVRELRTPAPNPKAEFYWGAMGTQENTTLGYGAGIMYKSPYKGIISLSITNSKQVQVGYYSKIF